MKDSGEDSLNTNAEYQVVLTIKIGIVRYILNTNTQLVYLLPEMLAIGFDCELEDPLISSIQVPSPVQRWNIV